MVAKNEAVHEAEECTYQNVFQFYETPLSQAFFVFRGTSAYVRVFILHELLVRMC